MTDADVIIVGSGPAGVSAAWPLVQAGMRVLMLDAATVDLPTPPPHATLAEWRADPLRWRSELGASGALADSAMSPKFATPLARATLGGFAEAAGLEARDGHVAVGSLAAGGLSRIWGALAARISAADLAGFPGGAAAMTAAYDRIAARIGVTGGTEISTNSGFTPPAAHMAGRHLRLPASDDFALNTAPNAVLTDETREGRQGCTACGLCLLGCARGSIYHSASELPALRRFANFSYRSGVRVERLGGAAGMQIVSAIAGGERITFRAPVVMLAAGTLMTTSLALRRIGLTGMPVRLETNPVGGAAFVVPRLIGAALPERSFGLGQMFYALRGQDGVETAGVFYGAETLPLSAVADRLPFTRPYALRASRALAPALLLATGYLPGSFSDNRLTVEDDGAGGRIVIESRPTPDADAALRRSFKALGHQARQRGAWSVPGSVQLLPPGADAHPAATLPVGGDGPAATDVDGELAGAAGVFVVDGAALPGLSARHPTLTIMANADRIGRAVAARMTSVPRIARAG